MSREKFQIVEEVDPASVTGITELQRSHYLACGYKPFRMSNGRIKWLTDANRVYRTAKSAPHSIISLKHPHIQQRGRRKRRSRNRVVVFLRENWLFMLVLALVLAAIVYFIRVM